MMGGPGVRPRPEDYAHPNEFHAEHQRAGYVEDGRCTICFAPLRDEMEQPMPEGDTGQDPVRESERTR